jgi:hypothetical protein
MALNAQQILNAKITVLTTSSTESIHAVPRTPVPQHLSIRMEDVMESSANLTLNVKMGNVGQVNA